MDGINKITESAIKTFAIERFEMLGYGSIYASFTAADRDNLLLTTMSGKVRVHL